MLDALTKYFNMMTRLRDPKTNDLTRKIILETGLPELMNTTSSIPLRNRIQKELANGYQGNQRAG